MLQIDDYYELLALHKALMEVRYLARDVDRATRGSAFLSDLHERVIDEMKAQARASGRPGVAVDWERWQVFADRDFEPPLIVDHLAQTWAKKLSSPELKREVVVNQLRPFKFSEDDVQRIIDELDRRTSEGEG